MKKALKETKRILTYLRINDEHDHISLTNIAMMLILYKIWLTTSTSIQDITALAVAVMGYQGKRIINGVKGKVKPKDLAEEFEELAEGTVD